MVKTVILKRKNLIKTYSELKKSGIIFIILTESEGKLLQNLIEKATKLPQKREELTQLFLVHDLICNWLYSSKNFSLCFDQELDNAYQISSFDAFATDFNNTDFYLLYSRLNFEIALAHEILHEGKDTINNRRILGRFITDIDRSILKLQQPDTL